MTNRVLLGKLPNGQYGLRVSRPGFDVTNDGLGNNAVAFDSRWSNAKALLASGYAGSQVNFTNQAAAPVVALQTFDSSNGFSNASMEMSGIWNASSDGMETATVFTNRIVLGNGINQLPFAYLVMYP